MSIYYRKEIDALRAVAVIPVLLFHAKVGGFSGGYVGVDVFFVISGYLITSIIVSERLQGSFSIWKFYERRARRILPALFAVILASLPFAWFWLTPEALKVFGGSLSATIAFFSNFFFWKQTGYFAPAAETEPLLHTWSLAVEEQYYVLFPIAILLILRAGPRALFAALILGAIVSFGLCEWQSHLRPAIAYFWTPFRAWELLIGAAIAVAHQDRPMHERIFRPIHASLGLLGLLLILFPVFFFDEGTRFPGISALLPTVGTGLILAFGHENSPVGRVLGHPLLVWIGLISYPLYLWHQPILAFWRIYEGRDLTNLEATAALSASVLLAVLTTYLLERPVRNRSIVGPRPLALGCGTAAAILLVAGAALQVTDGAPGRLPDSLKLLAAQGEVGASPAHCREQTEIAQPLDCTLGDPKAPPSIALWGDSFAGTLASVLGPPLAKEGLRAVRFVVHACPSIAGVMRKPARLGQAFGVSCHDYAERVLSVLRQSDQIRTVILYSSLSLYFETFTEDTGPIRANAASASTSEDGRREVLSERIIATARALAESGKTVILVGAHPKSTVADPHRVLSWALTHGEILLPPDEPRESFELSIAGINSRLREGAAKSQILFVDPDAIFCGEGQGRCSFMKGERFLLSDGVHLSKLGSSLLVEEIMSRLAPRSGSRVGRNEGGFDGRDLTEMSPAEH